MREHFGLTTDRATVSDVTGRHRSKADPSLIVVAVVLLAVVLLFILHSDLQDELLIWAITLTTFLMARARRGKVDGWTRWFWAANLLAVTVNVVGAFARQRGWSAAEQRTIRLAEYACLVLLGYCLVMSEREDLRSAGRWLRRKFSPRRLGGPDIED